MMMVPDGSMAVVMARLCPIPDGCASHCNRANTKPTLCASAVPKDQDVIQAFAPEGTDQTLNIWVLPRRPWRDRAVPDPHRSNWTGKGKPIGAIIVAYQIGRCRLPRECLHN